MGDFEVFVRPFVWRPVWPPAPALPVPPEDTPEQGVAVLRGLGGGLIDMSYSETQSWSKSRSVETQRQVDVERVYQKEKNPDGTETINEENYVDIERVKKVWMQEGTGEITPMHFATPPADDPKRNNIEVLETDVIIKNDAWAAGGGSASP